MKLDRSYVALAVLTCVFVASGCHHEQGVGDGGTSDASGPYTITLEPANQQLAVTIGTPKSLVYHAYDTRSGTKVEVVDRCTFSIVDTAMGSFTGNTFST